MSTRLDRWRTVGRELAVLAAFLGFGAVLTLLEYRLGLLDWVDPIGDEREKDVDVYATIAATQAAIAALVVRRRWRPVTRIRLAVSLAVGLAITMLELKAGWLDWTLPEAKDRPTRRDVPTPILVVVFNAAVVFGLGALARRAWRAGRSSA